MEKVLTEQQEKDLVMMTNLYFIFMEAADSILYRTEEYFDAMGAKMNGSDKVKHRTMMSQVKTLKNLWDNEIEKYGKDFCQQWHKWDELRRSAGYLVRICMLVSDRCGFEDDQEGVREAEIEKFLREMPSSGNLTESLLLKFKLR